MNSVIIVLGSPNDEQGNLSALGIARCEQAWQEYTKNPDTKVLCTGGFGASFNVTNQPHSFYTREYLINKGVPKTQFLPLVLSRFTLEDATLAKIVIEAAQITDAVLVTSDFHMTRAKFIFSYVFPTIQFSYAPALTILAADELAALHEHENKAMLREYKNKALFLEALAVSNTNK
ncbi:YdcF family protein [Colwellia sp. D2M02]|uniref:YdcF family protein n=1 Tax=Colwellia sp. D2M02 TaxID=2841562 RepID=UPI001C08BDBA|nr:YdcF family protein [Colwellia sp. D2M02]MBU2893075.1 YdcF family protein [Colwellia sp. D2M02]